LCVAQANKRHEAMWLIHRHAKDMTAREQ